MTFDKLKEEILKCDYCKESFGFTPQPVFFGKVNAKVFQVSQAPSNRVHHSNKPFDDLSGKKLKYSWYDITDNEFYNEENFYMTALAHCYPGKTASGNDRTPPKICTSKWLEKEVGCVSNELYIFIGRKAAGYFFPDKDFRELIFNNNIYRGKMALVLPHPSPLNIKWFKENPQFEEKRIHEIRTLLHEVII